MDKKQKELEKNSRMKALKKAQKKERNSENAMKTQKNKVTKKKGSSKQQYFDNIRKEKRSEELKVQRRSRKIKTVCVITVAAIIIAMIPFGVWFGVNKSGLFEKKNYFATSKDYHISNEQMSYYFIEGYTSFLDNYSDYLDSYGIDKDVSPKEQYYDEDSQQTWFDYLMENNLVPHVKQILTLDEAAKEEGFELSEDDITSANNILKGLDTSKYGDDVDDDEILEAIKLELLAQEYYQKLEDSFNYSDDEIEDYFDENKQEFVNCDYMYYTFSYSDDTSDGSLSEEDAYSLAEDAAKCTSEREFESWIKNYLTTNYPDSTEDDIETQIDNLKISDYACQEDDDASDWFCDESTKVNDTKVFSDTSSYTVVMLLSEPVKDDSDTNTVRLLYLDPELYEDSAATAEEIMKEYNDGDKTEDSFSDLVKSYSDDENTKYSGGLYESVTEGYLIDELDSWTFNSSRKNGDVETFDLSDGTYILYYCNKGEEAWKENVRSAMRNEAYETLYSELQEKYSITVSDDYTNIKAW